MSGENNQLPVYGPLPRPPPPPLNDAVIYGDDREAAIEMQLRFMDRAGLFSDDPRYNVHLALHQAEQDRKAGKKPKKVMPLWALPARQYPLSTLPSDRAPWARTAAACYVDSLRPRPVQNLTVSMQDLSEEENRLLVQEALNIVPQDDILMDEMEAAWARDNAELEQLWGEDPATPELNLEVEVSIAANFWDNWHPDIPDPMVEEDFQMSSGDSQVNGGDAQANGDDGMPVSIEGLTISEDEDVAMT